LQGNTNPIRSSPNNHGRAALDQSSLRAPKGVEPRYRRRDRPGKLTAFEADPLTLRRTRPSTSNSISLRSTISDLSGLIRHRQLAHALAGRCVDRARPRGGERGSSWLSGAGGRCAKASPICSAIARSHCRPTVLIWTRWRPSTIQRTRNALWTVSPRPRRMRLGVAAADVQRLLPQLATYLGPRAYCRHPTLPDHDARVTAAGELTLRALRPGRSHALREARDRAETSPASQGLQEIAIVRTGLLGGGASPLRNRLTRKFPVTGISGVLSLFRLLGKPPEPVLSRRLRGLLVLR
jgi:hypothetical protein